MSGLPGVVVDPTEKRRRGIEPDPDEEPATLVNGRWVRAILDPRHFR